MGSDRLEAYRITDFIIPMHILSNPAIANAIYEDGSHDIIPNVVDEYWIGIKQDNKTFACFRVHQMTSVMWQIHARVIPQYRREYSRRAAYLALKWSADNIKSLRTVVCMVPKCHRDVALFVRRVGFNFCGTIQESYKKNNILVGTDIFSINIDKIKELGV